MNGPRFYLILALMGLLLPWSQFVPFFLREGIDVPLFVSQLFVNQPASGFTLDFLWATLVFGIWSFYDSRQNNVPHWWAVLLAGACLGLSAAMPLYFVFRSMTLYRLGKTKDTAQLN